MQCVSCGAGWFLEEKLVRPAGLPRVPQHTTLPNRDMPHYRYRCADCGLVYGQEPQPKVEIKPETNAPAQLKKRGRPPKPKE